MWVGNNLVPEFSLWGALAVAEHKTTMSMISFFGVGMMSMLSEGLMKDSAKMKKLSGKQKHRTSTMKTSVLLR